jgi:hypothetical protein
MMTLGPTRTGPGPGGTTRAPSHLPVCQLHLRNVCAVVLGDFPLAHCRACEQADVELSADALRVARRRLDGGREASERKES